MKLAGMFVAAAMSVAALDASAQNCVGLQQIPLDASKGLADFFRSFMAANPPCGSAKVVWNTIVNREKKGGRRLEAERPLDVKKAQANLDAALKDPGIRARIDKARRQITDENALLAYEAAIFDEEGYYDARELKLQQLLQRLN